MKLRTLVIALLILVALGVYVFIVEIKGATEKLKTEQYEKKVFKINDWSEVKTIEIWNYQQHMVFEKLGKDGSGEENWQMRKPVDWPVDSSNFNSILSTFEFLEIEKKISGKDKKLSDFGLAKPPRIIVVKTNTKTLELLVGGLSPVGDSVYVKYPESDDILMVSAILDRQLKNPPMYFRDKRVFRVKANDIKGIEYKQRGKLLYKLEKINSDWHLKQPVELLADSVEVEKLLSKIEEMKIGYIPIEEISSLESYRLDSPEKTLTIYLNSGETQTLLVSSQLNKDGNRVFAKRDSWTQLLEIDKDVIAEFNLSTNQLRDKKVAHIEVKDLKEIVFKFADREIKLWATDDEHWHAEPIPDGKKLSEFWASNIGFHALKMRAKDFVTDSPTDKELKQWGLAKPTLKVEIIAKSGKIEGFELGNEAGKNRWYARLLSGGQVVILEDPNMDDFLQPEKSLWEEATEEKDGKDND